MRTTLDDANTTLSHELSSRNLGLRLRWIVCWEHGRSMPRKLVAVRDYPETEAEWGEIYSLVLLVRDAAASGERYMIVLAHDDHSLITLLDDDDFPWMTVAVDRDDVSTTAAQLATLAAMASDGVEVQQ